MFKKLKIFGIVPARSGSKGLPGKNIKFLAGKPLLAWAVEAGLKSDVLEKVMILTDSPEYGEIAKKYGAEFPFLRPPELATDTSPVVDSLRWLVEQLLVAGERPDYLVLLEPTAPGRQAQHVRKLVELVINAEADSGFTVMRVPTGYNAHWQFNVNDVGEPAIVTGDRLTNIKRRRQDLPPLYVRGGSTYVFRPECLLGSDPSIYGRTQRVLVIDSKYAIDLDTPEDWLKAERLMLELHQITK